MRVSSPGGKFPWQAMPSTGNLAGYSINRSACVHSPMDYTHCSTCRDCFHWKLAIIDIAPSRRTLWDSGITNRKDPNHLWTPHRAWAPTASSVSRSSSASS